MQTDGFIKSVSINNLSAHSKFIIRLSLKMKFIIQNQLPYGEYERHFYFWNSNVSLYMVE